MRKFISAGISFLLLFSLVLFNTQVKADNDKTIDIPETLHMTVGETTTISAGDTNGNPTWEWDHHDVISLQGGSGDKVKGLTLTVQALKEGTATITVRHDNGKNTPVSTCTVIVGPGSAIPVTGVTLDKSTLTLTAGGATGSLTATVNPTNATNKNVTWSSSDTSVASVDSNGVITPLKVGTAIITVTTEDGNKTANCTVTVGNKPAFEINVDKIIGNFAIVSIVPDISTLAANTVWETKVQDGDWINAPYPGVFDSKQVAVPIPDSNGNILNTTFAVRATTPNLDSTTHTVLIDGNGLTVNGSLADYISAAAMSDLGSVKSNNENRSAKVVMSYSGLTTIPNIYVRFKYKVSYQITNTNRGTSAFTGSAAAKPQGGAFARLFKSSNGKTNQYKVTLMFDIELWQSGNSSPLASYSGISKNAGTFTVVARQNMR